MKSRVGALVRSFLRSDGDALYLVPGEKMYLTKGTAKTVVGREPLSLEAFASVAAELAPERDAAELAAARHRVSFRSDPDLEEVDIRFGLLQGLATLMICRLSLRTAATAQVAAPEPAPARVQPAALRSAPAPASAETAAGVPYRTDPLDDMLARMVESKASDLHLSSGVTPIFRVHGEILQQDDMPLLYSDEVEKLVSHVMPEKNRKEYAERNDTDFAYEIEGLARFRVNVFRDRHGVGAVFRQIPIEVLTVEELKLPPAVVRLGDLSKGLVLVTGPTGSGKSTTLAAIVDYVNKTRTDHIITIEDPIEFVHRNRKCLVNQREVGSHTRSFKDALRAALREDPDVVLVGEMRDLETIAIAIETAETGHLVFGTLHTTTATSTVDRIVDQFPADRQQQIRTMLADSLKGVVAQILCRRVGGGRVAALEILLSNNAVANLIRDGKTFQLPSVLQTSKAQGMVLLNDSLLALVKAGQVEAREAYIKAVDKTGLLVAFRNNNIAVPEAGEEAAAPPTAPGAGAPGTPQSPPGTPGPQQARRT